MGSFDVVACLYAQGASEAKELPQANQTGGSTSESLQGLVGDSVPDPNSPLAQVGTHLIMHVCMFSGM